MPRQDPPPPLRTARRPSQPLLVLRLATMAILGVAAALLLAGIGSLISGTLSFQFLGAPLNGTFAFIALVGFYEDLHPQFAATFVGLFATALTCAPVIVLALVVAWKRSVERRAMSAGMIFGLVIFLTWVAMVGPEHVPCGGAGDKRTSGGECVMASPIQAEIHQSLLDGQSQPRY